MSQEQKISPEDIKLPDVEVLVTNFIAVMINKAYTSLGLLGEKKEVNLKQAKMAIDIIPPLFDSINSHLDEKVKQDLMQMITTIRMAYVQASSGKQ